MKSEEYTQEINPDTEEMIMLIMQLFVGTKPNPGPLADLHKEQYSSSRGRSTIDVGTTLLKHIFNAWEDSQDAIGVFCDPLKALNTYINIR